METPQYVFDAILNADLGPLEERVTVAFKESLREGYATLTEYLSATVILTRQKYPSFIAEQVVKMQEDDTRALFVAIGRAFKEAEVEDEPF